MPPLLLHLQMVRLFRSPLIRTKNRRFRQARYQGHSYLSPDPGNEVKVPSHSYFNSLCLTPGDTLPK